ncbi:hypothetical protein JCM16303_000137 [Sporobolomyces ruberrimus]
MANPRQRLKNRSGGRLKTSKQSLKNKHKVIVKGPEVLAKNWDKTKTVRQNYAALGLLGTLDPRQVGGLEPALDHVPYAVRSATNPTTLEEIDEIVPDVYESSDDEAEDEDESTTAAVGQKKKKSVKGKEKEEPKAKKLAPGMARIIRDENGNVLKIVVGDEDGEEVEEDVVAPNRGGEESEDEDSEEEEEAEAKPWGEAMKDWDVGQDRFVDEDEEMEDEERDPRKFKQGIPIEGALKRVTAKTDVVRALEARAANKTKVIRHTSEFEKERLVALVEKYDEDIEKMARDRKANVWQKTPGELRRMINKAGGFEKLRAAARA